MKIHSFLVIQFTLTVFFFFLPSLLLFQYELIELVVSPSKHTETFLKLDIF